MNYDSEAFHWCFTFKADLAIAILCWCLPEIKAMSPSHPPCQGHTHHRFTGLSAQVMHGSHSSQSEAVFITNYVRHPPTHHRQAFTILGLLLHSPPFCREPIINSDFLICGNADLMTKGGLRVMIGAINSAEKKAVYLILSHVLYL